MCTPEILRKRKSRVKFGFFASTRGRGTLQSEEPQERGFSTSLGWGHMTSERRSLEAAVFIHCGLSFLINTTLAATEVAALSRACLRLIPVIDAGNI